MISTSNLKPCEECGKISCNDKQCLKEPQEPERKGRYRPAKTT